MKYTLTIIGAALFLASCSNSADTDKKTTIDSTDFEVEVVMLPFDQSFPELNQYYTTQDSSFDAGKFEPGEVLIKENTGLALDTSEFRIYKPYYLYNADSSFALDLVSYNYLPVERKGKTLMADQGPDFEAAIIDLKNKERSRLLFFGPSGATILDAKWTDASTVIMAGAVDWNNGDSLRPSVWKYNAVEKTWQQYIYPQMIRADWSKYGKRLYQLK